MSRSQPPVQPDALPGRIAFVHAAWHDDIVQQGKAGFLEEMAELGVSTEAIDFFQVPGAFELPLSCKNLALSREYCLIAAAGFVVDGGIYRHEFVAQAVISGLMDVQLESRVPVLSMVLTPKSFHDNQQQYDFFFQHFRGKGEELARTAAGLLNLENRSSFRAVHTTVTAAG